MSIKFVYENGDKLGPQFKKRVQVFTDKMKRAEIAAARQAAADIERLGRNNIRSGGDFGSARWQQGFRALLSFAGNAIRIRVTHAVRYWKVFEEGRVIRGRPLLWIPLNFSNAGRLLVRARDYPGKLFRVDRAGRAPLLLDKNGPQYFGKEQVHIPKKWNLREIVRRVARRMPQYYKDAMRNGK